MQKFWSKCPGNVPHFCILASSGYNLLDSLSLGSRGVYQLLVSHNCISKSVPRLNFKIIDLVATIPRSFSALVWWDVCSSCYLRWLPVHVYRPRNWLFYVGSPVYTLSTWGIWVCSFISDISLECVTWPGLVKRWWRNACGMQRLFTWPKNLSVSSWTSFRDQMSLVLLRIKELVR